MGKKDVYRYWAAFHYADDGVSVRFPDLPGCLTFGNTDEEAHAAAREALEGFIYGLEKDGDPIPDPTPLSETVKVLDEDEAAVEVKVYMPTVRDAMESKAVKKTLTIPKWLNDEAEKQNINFSQVLQEALKRNLGIEQQQ
ncbi:type II toxin-antitoxin system HicB family antitoxin [Cohnella nanjingensis]|uniref:Type II toxin-antitoxin system HicB family antitoxin n=1 Tax=Cohnella nanjingensis TaxID=1387779 RepID=A0A7X0RSQ8_9BACL|nr:type II toxin-antitoxin system HicB family antitoxin [Cohnella nanjingensis]MBB6673034.1 type II toxin-antitoxin system HicB family antitoxin [Cohnella nanjingensis]